MSVKTMRTRNNRHDMRTMGVLKTTRDVVDNTGLPVNNELTRQYAFTKQGKQQYVDNSPSGFTSLD